MLAGYNIEHMDAIILFTQAIKTSPKYPLARSFDLADLGRHNILEHDISLRYVIPLFSSTSADPCHAVDLTHSLPTLTRSMRRSGPSPSPTFPTT